MKERILRGIPVSGNFGYGKIIIYQPDLSVEKIELSPGMEKDEILRLEEAIAETEKDFKKIYENVRAEMGKDIAELISIQLSFLKDPTLISETKSFIQKFHTNAEFAYCETIKRLGAQLLNTTAGVFADKKIELLDVCSHLINKLKKNNQKEGAELLALKEPGVVFAHSLAPMVMALLDKNLVCGLALELGGKASHVSIMARAKGIPTVVGVENLLHYSAKAQKAIVDGSRGMVILEPLEKRLLLYQKEEQKLQSRRSILLKLKEVEPVTRDGRYIDISANIEFLAESVQAKELGAKGVGLFRTEYIFLSRRRLPTEDEQFALYEEVAEKMKPYPVIIRTFDLGGDKLIPNYSEANPFLGWRGIRFSLSNPEVFKCQLRAILRASKHRNLKIMIPMVSAVEELVETKKLLWQIKSELKEKNIEFDENIELGIMVETPSAVLIAESLARLCNFFSIGSNDLTQYTLACDRGNERVAHLFNHYHPAVLNLIKETIERGHRHGIWVGLCGEMAGEPIGIVLLLGMGIDELSMSAQYIPQAKELITSLDTSFCKEIANQALKFSTPIEVIKYVKRKTIKNVPKLVDAL